MLHIVLWVHFGEKKKTKKPTALAKKEEIHLETQVRMCFVSSDLAVVAWCLNCVGGNA